MEVLLIVLWLFAAVIANVTAMVFHNIATTAQVVILLSIAAVFNVLTIVIAARLIHVGIHTCVEKLFYQWKRPANLHPSISLMLFVMLYEYVTRKTYFAESEGGWISNTITIRK